MKRGWNVLKINVCDIDSMLNKDVVGLDIALQKIENYIVAEIDPTFPIKDFNTWVNSDEDKPFRWNKRLYTWSN